MTTNRAKVLSEMMCHSVIALQWIRWNIYTNLFPNRNQFHFHKTISLYSLSLSNWITLMDEWRQLWLKMLNEIKYIFNRTNDVFHGYSIKRILCNPRTLRRSYLIITIIISLNHFFCFQWRDNKTLFIFICWRKNNNKFLDYFISGISVLIIIIYGPAQMETTQIIPTSTHHNLVWIL